MSEVAINELPEGWELVQLQDVCSKITDGTHKTPKYQDKGVRFISIKNIKPFKPINWDSYEKYISQEEHEELIKRCNPEYDDIVFPRIGTLGYAKRIDFKEEVSLFVGLGLLKPIKEVINPKYLEYWMNHPIIYKLSHQRATGSGRLTLALAESKKLPVPLAPTEQQKRIVAKIEELFSHIDAGIEALKKAKQLLKQYRQSVLKAAVTGELTKEWREENKAKLEPASDVHGSTSAAVAGREGAAQLLECILKERRQKWEEQQLEQFKAKGKMPKDDKWKDKYKEAIEFDADIEIPYEWVGSTTDQVFCYITSGSRGWAKYYSEEGPIFLRMGNLEHYDVRLDLEDIQRANPPEGAEGSRTKVEAGDSLISITADVGMVGIVPDGFEEAYINQHVALARPVISEMGLYLAWLLSGDFAKEQFKALQRGATKVGLGLDDIRAIQFGLPSLEEQEEIVRLIEEKLSTIEHLDTELDQQLLKAEKSKQSILASAFSGGLH